ncbi:MAG: DUF5682 family protein, partial [Planctomycetia bacterium]
MDDASLLEPRLLERLADPQASVVYVPVRHHSPAAARAVVAVIEDRRPAVVLIEGPSDFNDRLEELHLPHVLPIAVYSFARGADGARRGAYHPFCVYSPEWQALTAARRVGAPAWFIDQPWIDQADRAPTPQRYSDGPLRRGAYVDRLCDRLGVDDFDALWDELFEVDGDLTPAEYLRRAHHFCLHLRALEGVASPQDVDREAYMAARIAEQVRAFPAGPIVVVTGGFHSSALLQRLEHPERFPAAPPPPQPPTRDPADSFTDPPDAPTDAPTEHGIALTPYSYERLDRATGYDAGMPHPGFYDLVWRARTSPAVGAAAQSDADPFHRRMLARAAGELRRRRQIVGTADLVAVELAAQGLARLRGRREVWRTDLRDAVIGALVKDDLSAVGRHPFLEAVDEVFRGDARGRLAPGCPRPPLVEDVHRQLQSVGLSLDGPAVEETFDLLDPAGRAASRVLHRLQQIGVAGATRLDGADLWGRADLVEIWERWRLRWSPDFDATAVEASRYGATLPEAAAARLLEQAEAAQRDAAVAARLLLDAALAGLDQQFDALAA